MKTYFSRKKNLVPVLILLVLVACKNPKKDSETPSVNIPLKVFVLNEGSFGNGNASVSVLDAATNTIYNNQFFASNGRPLGDVLQSMAVINGRNYFVVNNSNKIEITENYPLTSVGVIKGLKLPRYIIQVSPTKAFVSEYVDYSSPTGRLSIVDLLTNTVTGTIDVGLFPEQMILKNGKLFVCISGEDEITVINPVTNAITDHISVTESPNSIVADGSGNLWVSCGGDIAYDGNWEEDPLNSVAGALVKIDPSTNSVSSTLTFSNTTGSPSSLVINGAKNTLYYSYTGKVFQHSTVSSTLNNTPLISRSFYGLGVDPITNQLYIGTYGFSSNQRMVRYSKEGVALDSLTVGVGPNGFLFNY